MGKQKRLHRKAVIAGTEKPYRASTDKPKASADTRSVSEKLLERVRKLKEG